MPRVGVVTGGAGAIGGAIAAALRRSGHTVEIVDLEGAVPVDLAQQGEVVAAAETVLARRMAIDRDLVPEDVASAVTFLASAQAGAITGQTLCADGGLVLR